MLNFFDNDPLLTGFNTHYLDEINATIPWYPLLMYMFCRILGSKNIVEVGIAEGYSTFYLAHAAKINEGMYYGIDIRKKWCQEADEHLTSFDLPHQIFHKDTKLIDKIDFTDRIDIAFLDGEHNTEAVQHEIDLIYPLLHDRGWGYIFIHDIIDPGNADIWYKLQSDSRFEKIGFNPNYGLGILRKLEGLDYKDIADRLGVLKSDQVIEPENL